MSARKLSIRERVRRYRHRRTLRCDHCKGRFRLDEDLFGYSSSDKTWHEFCMAYRHQKSVSADLIAYVQGVADRDALFRVEHMYLGLDALTGPLAGRGDDRD